MKSRRNVSEAEDFRMYEIWDGKRYMFDVSPSENPRQVLEETQGLRLRMIEVFEGNRAEIASYIPQIRRDPEEEYDFTEDEFGEELD